MVQVAARADGWCVFFFLNPAPVCIHMQKLTLDETHARIRSKTEGKKKNICLVTTDFYFGCADLCTYIKHLFLYIQCWV